MCVRPFPVLAASLLLCNCAIHPVPEDVTGVNTYHIVRQIRCETREAAAKFVLRELKRLGSDHEDQAADTIAQSLVGQYEANPELISTFTPDLFPGPKYAQVRNFYRVIYSAAIAYNFDLTMTEQNNVGTIVNLFGPWTPNFMLGLTADANRSRSNERSFTITDTFSELLKGLNTPVRGKRYCDGQIAQSNYIYPIAGRIGVDELVMTFFELVFLGGLSADKANPGAIGPPTIADKLTFTTTIDGSASPKVLFSPVGTGFQVSDASITGMASRTDAHQVSVGLALDPSAMVSLTSLRGYLFSRERSIGAPAASVAGAPSGVLVVNTLTAQARTSAEKLAVIAIDQLKSREVQLVRAR